MSGEISHDCGITQVADVALQALDPRVRDTADLGTVKTWQAHATLHAVKIVHEALACFHIPEVNKGIAHVAAALKVHRQIEEVKSAAELEAQFLQKHRSRVIVRNVAKHHCCVLHVTSFAPATRSSNLGNCRDAGVLCESRRWPNAMWVPFHDYVVQHTRGVVSLHPLGSEESQWSTRITEDEGLPFGMIGKLLSYIGLTQTLYIGVQSLHSGTGDMTDLATVEAGQTRRRLDSMEGDCKAVTRGGIPEIYEGIAHVAVIIEIHRHVEEVERPSKVLTETAKQPVPCVVVGNVPQHRGGW
mmetsp:Transcript_61177/g.162574  ORF Transcript_61177/g.162574 Transcript_61177/m.162574 type:complete len:300 (-) Transcript_61177:1298-2197(-)